MESEKPKPGSEEIGAPGEFKRASTDEWLLPAAPPSERTAEAKDVDPAPDENGRAKGPGPGPPTRNPVRERRRGAAKLRSTAKQVEGHDQVLEGHGRTLEELNLRFEGMEARIREAEQRALAAEKRAEEAERLTSEVQQRAEAAERRAESAERGAGEAVLQERRRRADLAQHHEETRTRVAQAERKLEGLGEFEAQAEQVEERVKRIEASVASADSMVRKLASPPPSSGPPPSSAPSPSPAPPPEPEPEPPPEDRGGGLLDLNKATFEQLRQIGLSVTQAARLLASRDARGGFASLSELRGLWDFPAELVESLARRLRVG